MPDLDIRDGELDQFSHALRELSDSIAAHADTPHAMPGGSAYKQAQYAGEHIEDELEALKASLASLADNVQACATEFRATEDINDQSMRRIMADTPAPCPPVGPAKDK